MKSYNDLDYKQKAALGEKRRKIRVLRRRILIGCAVIGVLFIGFGSFVVAKKLGTDLQEDEIVAYEQPEPEIVEPQPEEEIENFDDVKIEVVINEPDEEEKETKELEKKQEEQKKAEEAKKAEELKKAEEQKKLEEAKKAEELKKAEEEKKAEELKKAEEERLAKEQKEKEEQEALEKAKAEQEKAAQEAAAKANEGPNIKKVIDVSVFQGSIDWAQVAASGVDCAIIRVGLRKSTTGEILEDGNAKYNLSEAAKNGLKVGAYFFSTAATQEEAIEEANWVADYISGYSISLPVVFNCENYEKPTSRQYNLTKDERSNIAMAFLGQIQNRGYTPMFYASRSEMVNNTKWNTSQIEQSYMIWLAWYSKDLSTLETGPNYSGKCSMWQYTDKAIVPGASKPVDMSAAYF